MSKTATFKTKTTDAKSTPPAAKSTSFLLKTFKPSAALAAFVGEQPLPRTEAVQRLWEYIKANNLQNSAKRHNIQCDGPLKALMGKDEISMFELTRLTAGHLSEA